MTFSNAFKNLVGVGILGLCCLLTSPTWMTAGRAMRLSGSDHAAVLSACQTLMAAHAPDASTTVLAPADPAFAALPVVVTALEPETVSISSAQVVIRAGGSLTAQRARVDLGTTTIRREVLPGLWLEMPD